MTVYNVIASGGEYDSYWSCTECCFDSKELADEYVVKRKEFIKRIQNDEEKFSKMFNAFGDEIDTDGKPYFNVYGASFEDFINKLETYKDRNNVIYDFLNTNNRNYIKQLHKFYMDECMLGNSMRNCRISLCVVPMHVNTSLLEVSDKL